MAISKNLLEDLMYQSEKPALQTTVNPTILNLLSEGKLTDRQLETMSAIQTVNQVFSGKLPDISDFMTGVAAAETQLGNLVSPVSYSPFQIDPIRYKDVLSRKEAGEQTTIDRANIANEFLQSMGYGEGFDILGLSSDLNQIRDPLIGAFLTRMSLANIAKPIPTNIAQQGEYWKDYWNSHAPGAKGTPQKYISEKKYFDSLLNLKTYDNTVLE